MLITSIELENIKSYQQVTIHLQRGTTAISGVNGAGKTTLVEAIGYALFGYLPYNSNQFVREGEKTGKIVVHLIGSDDRPYTVERRCGSGSRWLIHDEEANVRLEQRADVIDKLHDLFGIDRERPLDSLFRDALGVPQGTFTAIFLDTASKRKQTFDTLLQIEDYKVAADNLLETQRYYKDQAQLQHLNIQRLEYETRDLESWLSELQEVRLLDEQQKLQLARQSQQLLRDEERKDTLDRQYADLQALEMHFHTAEQTLSNALNLLSVRERTWHEAQMAQQAVLETQEDHRRYEQAETLLRALRQRAQQRDILRSQLAELKNQQTEIAGKLHRWQDGLDEVKEAYREVARLAPLVDKQIELEQHLTEARQRAVQYENIVKDGKRLREQYDRFLQAQQEAQQKLGEIEPLIPLANQLEERLNILNQVRLQAAERVTKQGQLQEKRNNLRAKQEQSNQLAEQLRSHKKHIAAVEAHRQEAEELPSLQSELEQLLARMHRLEGNIEGYVRSRAQSAGGQCPLLNESCLNIRQHGITSLESYFDNLLTDEHDALTALQQRQSILQQQIQKIRPFADELNRLEQYSENRDYYEKLAQEQSNEMQRIEGDIQTLSDEISNLQTIDQQVRQAQMAYNESRSADVKTREHEALARQVNQYQQEIEQLNEKLQDLRQEAALYKDGKAQVEQILRESAELGDPRSESRAKQATIAREPYFLQQFENATREQLEISQQIQAVEQKLAAYATLDREIVEQEVIAQQTLAKHNKYLRFDEIAQQLPEREHAYQEQRQISQQAEQRRQMLGQEFEQANAAFDPQERDALKQEIDRLKNEQNALLARQEQLQKDIRELEQKIARAEELRVELQAAQNEYNTFTDLQTMTEQFRRLIKDAAPHVLRAMLTDISAEANRIFGEVMGDRSAQLSWHNDYEIILRRQGVDRSFAQLSGGEQMSAALSVRLALLKKLSTLNVAFFDEPTQNMDEMRRMNLAEQIRRVRGFDQLIVISHDDTFEQGLDSLIRLNKVRGETKLLDDESAEQIGRQEISEISTVAF
ncbi:MAG TPA: SMC family ATPase [Dictyobacter sp.]|nr:SMC family ATPase [Dictyobacter sp.]